MQAASALLRTIEAADHHVEFKITIGGVEIPASKVEAVKLDGSLFTEYGVGNCNLRSANLRIQGNYHPGAELVVYARLADATRQSEWIQLCTLIVYSRELVDETYSDIVAYDALAKTDYVYKRTPTWTDTTMDAVVQAICTEQSLTLTTRAQGLLPGYEVADPNGMTAREILAEVATAACANWCTTYDGKLDLVPLKVPASVYALAAKNIQLDSLKQKLTYSGWVGVELEGQSLVYRSPSGQTEAEWEALKQTGRIMSTRCEWATQAMADAILSSLQDTTVEFSPWAATVNADICAELGDGVTVLGVQSIFGHYSFDCSGGRLFGEIGAHGISNIEYLDRYTPKVERMIAAEADYRKASIEVVDNRITATVEDFSTDVGLLQTQITQNASGIEAVATRQDEQESYVRWDGATSTVIVGATDEPTEAQISPQGFAVVQNGETILDAKGHHIIVKHLEAETVAVGRYQWVDEDANGFSLIYMGE